MSEHTFVLYHQMFQIFLRIRSKYVLIAIKKIFLLIRYPAHNSDGTDYGREVRKLPLLHSRKSTPTPKFLGTAEAYFVCHIGPNFQISLIYAFIGCP